MKFFIKDLVQIIGRKYGLELSDDIRNDFSSIDTEKVPAQFLEEFQNIVMPLLSDPEENESKFDSKDDLYQLIPKEYFDELNLIDDDGKLVMSMSELRKAVNHIDPEVKTVNTNNNADRERDILRASYVHDDYPVNSGLEHSWRLLESDYKVVDREDHPASDPLSSFSYYLDLGFYPPPEIMKIIGTAVQIYFTSGGSMSLDEAFFGEKYKKTISPAYKKHKKMKYGYFEFHANMNRDKKEKNGPSLETVMAKAIEKTPPAAMVMLGFDPDIDIDTFMRGYRRWKKELKEGKLD